jgi:hypothetical protein
MGENFRNCAAILGRKCIDLALLRVILLIKRMNMGYLGQV